MNVMQNNYPLSINIRQRVFPNKITHIARSLEGKGKILVSKNEELQPQDVIGKITVSGGFSAINIAKKLGVSPEEGDKYLQRQLGSKIFQGELLAMKKGMFGKKVIVSPTDGIIDVYDKKSGEVKLQFLPKEVPITSGVYGIVDDINIISGEVLIKAMVTEIYGVIGTGKERGGILTILGEQGTFVQPRLITQSMSNHIIVTGALIYGEALRKATGYRIHGIISGGLNAKDYRSMAGTIDPMKKIGNDVGITVMATEGYGPIPIGDDIYHLLQEYEERFVFIHGNTSQLLLPSVNPDSILSLRKTALPISKNPRVQPDVVMGELKIGVRVRIIWPPFMGAQGIVTAIDGSSTMLDSGITTFVVTVETPRQKIRVPYPNIEIIK